MSFVLLAVATTVAVALADDALQCESEPAEMALVISAMLANGYEFEQAYLQDNLGLSGGDPSFAIEFYNHNHGYLTSAFPANFNLPATRFSSNDVLVWAGCTPPKIDYFSFIAYSAADSLYYEEGGVGNTHIEMVQSSLGPSANPLTIKTRHSASAPFDAWTVNVVTHDWHGFEAASDAFADAGLLPNNEINLHRVPEGYFTFSDEIETFPRSSIMTLLRVVDYDITPEQQLLVAAYVNQTQPLYLFRKASVDGDTNPIQKTDTNELVPFYKAENNFITKFFFDCAVEQVVKYYASAQNQNGEYVLQSNDAFLQTSGSEVSGLPIYLFDYGDKCIEDGNSCLMDNRDSLYQWVQKGFHLTDDDMYVVVGMNTDMFDMSIYNSLSIYHTIGRKAGNFQPIDGGIISNREYEDYSLADVIGNHKYLFGWLDELKYRRMFMVQVTRPENCLNTDRIPSFCLDQESLTEDEEFVFFMRRTLNPQTGTKPDESQVIAWRLLHFVKQ